MTRFFALVAGCLLLSSLHAQETGREKALIEKEEEPKAEKAPMMPEGLTALNKQKTLFLENPKGGPRKVHLLAEVVLRQGPLEVFLCKFQTKEHEAILNCDVNALDVHQALLVAGGKPGKPVQFRPDYVAASGSKIDVTITFMQGDKQVTKPAQHWIRDAKAKKEMQSGWVFPGSRLMDDIDNPGKKYYCANNGEIVSLSNFPDSMLDLPIPSSSVNEGLAFEAWTDRIPGKGTKVLVTLTVIPEEKK
jgi:hypothetical protein